MNDARKHVLAVVTLTDVLGVICRCSWHKKYSDNHVDMETLAADCYDHLKEAERCAAQAHGER